MDAVLLRDDEALSVLFVCEVTVLNGSFPMGNPGFSSTGNHG